jgi:hypothetical protein
VVALGSAAAERPSAPRHDVTRESAAGLMARAYDPLSLATRNLTSSMT